MILSFIAALKGAAWLVAGRIECRRVSTEKWLILYLLLSVEEHVTCSDNGDDDKHMCKHIALILLRSKG